MKVDRRIEFDKDETMALTQAAAITESARFIGLPMADEKHQVTVEWGKCTVEIVKVEKANQASEPAPF